ncbi:LacI family DNA-binding transcriptional regulator [Glutamicibacter sp. NPDC087344]|uniref:LacI family DNA-binding transcriptional regulator n=1 Tax=Glutamicibacter sp. NPDC087344 TaxID=3363994 RepID=UPI003822DB64
MNIGEKSAGKKPPRRVTAAMVAEHAGVSTATVSLVANGKSAGRVSKHNEERVRESIRELGYFVDSIGSSLAKGVSSLVILVAPDISNPFFAKVIAGVRSVLGDDYQLLLSVTDAGISPSADETRRLLGLRPAGLLVHAPTKSFLEDLAGPLPLVALDAPGINPEIPAVNMDVAQGAQAIVAHFARLGHTKAAYLDGSTGTDTLTVRRDAFLRAAARHGIEVLPTNVARSMIDVSAASTEFTRNWQDWEDQGVTALACATDTQAFGVLHAARHLGIRIPHRLAVTGFDDLPYSATSNPSITSVQLNATEVGRQAALKLRELIDGQTPILLQSMLPSSLVVRGSTTADGGL